MLLLVDNGSVYTKHLVKLLGEAKVPFEMQTPGALDLGSLGVFDSFILSGRRRNDPKTNVVNSRVVLHAVGSGKKLFGICYGAEIMALALGGTIARSAALRKGRQRVTIYRENPLCSGDIDVYESHGFEISRLPDGLACLGRSEVCRYELVQYGGRPVFGVQFHPEMSPDGRRMVQRFCSL